MPDPPVQTRPRSTPSSRLSVLSVLRACAALFGMLWPAVGATQAPVDEPTSLGTGSLTVTTEAGRRAAPTLETDVDIRIFGLIARTRVVQSFVNPSDDWADATYAFPLPEGAAVDTLQMIVGERVIVGEIQERQRARATYEAARAAGQRASLLEQQRPNLFTTRVANLGPREKIEVLIEYQETPRYESGRFTLRFPMVATPRYDPSTAGATISQQSSGESAATELPRATVRVAMDASYDLDWIDSPSHRIEAQRSGDGYSVELGSVPANADFVLHWAASRGEVPQLVSYREDIGAYSYVQLLLIPPSPQRADLTPRQTVFVIDTSGSMAGASIRQAKAALATALETLHAEDTFNVVEFNSRARALFETPQRVDSDSLETAHAFVQGLVADGGTEIGEALGLAFAQPADPQRLEQILFITDGAVSNEEQLLSTIYRDLGERRLFTVGIGSAPNGYFMRRAAEFGRGTYTFIGDIEEVEVGIEELLAKIEAPVLTDLSLDAPADAEIWPRRLVDLYAGEPLSVALRVSAGTPLELELKGASGTETLRLQATPPTSQRHPGVGKLWARAQLRSLQDDLSRGGDAEDIRRQATTTALEHRIVSRYTSFVAVEQKPSRPSSEDSDEHEIASHAPRGTDVLPIGGTSSYRWALLGLGLLVAAGSIRRLAP